MNDQAIITEMILRRAGDHTAEGRTIIDYLLILEKLLERENK